MARSFGGWRAGSVAGFWALSVSCGSAELPNDEAQRARATATRLAVRYDIVEIDYPADTFGSPVAINDHGLVLGEYCIDDTYGVLFSWSQEDGAVDLTPRTGKSSAVDINNQGIYVASDNTLCWGSYDSDNLPIAASNISGSHAPLPSPDGATSYLADGMNDSNVMVGNSIERRYGGWRYDGDGNEYEFYEDLGALGFWPTAINNQDVAAGCHDDGVPIFQDGSLEVVEALGGYTCSREINETGAVVGWSQPTAFPDAYHAFVYANGRVLDLVPKDRAGPELYHVANAINDGNVVVGAWAGSESQNQTAFGWSEEDGAVELMTRLAEPGDWYLYWASDINEAGQIIGWAVHDQRSVGFLMTPQPLSGESD